jgi:hypothetical protein
LKLAQAEFQDQIIELSMDEAYGVTGGGGPENNPPGLTNDGEPVNNPPG